MEKLFDQHHVGGLRFQVSKVTEKYTENDV